MGSFKLAGMTFGSIFKKPETLMYPFVKKEPYPGQKGHIVNNVDECILCAKCQKTCPCNCITVNKADRIWEINPFMCIQCGSCVRACPKNCLTMDGHYTSVTGEKFSKNLDVPEKEKKAKKEAVTAE